MLERYLDHVRRLRPWHFPGHFVTTPVSLLKRLTGQEAWTDPVTLAAGSTVGGTPIDAASRLVAVAAATTTLTLTAALHAGRMLQIASTGGLAITPPPATGTGNMYQFMVTATVSGGNFTIDAKAGAAADVFYGGAFQNKPGTGVTTTFSAANSNLLTFNGSTSGGLVGDRIEMLDVAPNVWWLFIMGQYSGTFGSPFSNH